MDTPDPLCAVQTHRQVLRAAEIPAYPQTFCPPFPLPAPGPVHLIQPSLKPVGARGHEIRTWEQQGLETNREANTTKHSFMDWSRHFTG